MEKVKVIHVITRLDKGGSAENTLLTCLGLAERYELALVHGLSLESRMTDREKKAVEHGVQEAERKGVKVIAIPWLVRKISPVQDLLALLSLWRLMIREKPTIVHTHTSKAGILGRCAAKIAGVPIIVHSPHGHVFYGHFGHRASRFFLFVERLMALITDCMIALTKAERKDYIVSSVSDPARIATIHSGVEIDRYVKVKVNIEGKKRSLGLNPQWSVVGTVGWLLPIKGPMYLLKAMARVWQSHPETTLVYAGKGDLEEQLKAEALRMGVSDRVIFLGWRDDIPDLMQILDVFVLPSLNEGMGRVLVEAMAAGKPIVASNVGGIPDSVIEGENGLLVPAGDTKALGSSIEILIANPEKRREMGEKGRKIAKRYGSASMVQKVDELYLQLLGEKAIPRLGSEGI